MKNGPFKNENLPYFASYIYFSSLPGTNRFCWESQKQDMEKYEGVYFPVFDMSTTYNRQISYMSKIRLGMTISYDGSVDAQVAIEENELESVDGPLTDKIQLSIYPSYELVMNKVSLVIQPAVYLYRKK
jgi:hypothetical protein